MKPIVHALVPALVLSFAPVVHAGAKADAQFHVARKEFRNYVKETPGVRKDHFGALAKATGRTALGGALYGGIGAYIGNLWGGKGMIIGGAVGAGLTVPGMHKTNLKGARTQTVANGVEEGTLSHTVAEKWQKAGLINKDWK